MYFSRLLQSPKEYERIYNDVRGSEFSVYHGYAFDGIWVIAKALDTILKKENYPVQLEDRLFRGEAIALALNETDFVGVTVSIHI